jgi:hypothetical protein
LDDSSEIYQPREIKSEKQKLKEMSFHEKLEYINAYYKYKLLATIIILGIIISLFYTILTPKDETVFNAAILNQYLDSQKKDELITDFSKYLDISEKQNIVFDDSFYMSDNNSPITASSTALEKLQTYVYTNQLDVIIADESVFKDFANWGYFDNLNDRLPTDLYSKLTEQLFISTTQDDSEEKAYGIYLTDNKVIRDLGILAEKPVIGIVANSKYKNNSISFLRYIFDLQ